MKGLKGDILFIFIYNIYLFILSSTKTCQNVPVNSPRQHRVEQNPQTPDVTGCVVTLLLQNLQI